MKTVQQYRGMLVYMVLAATAVTTLSAAMASAAYDPYDRQGQQPQQDQRYQQQRMQQQSMQWGRNQRLEQQVAQQLRQQGFGEQGQILILAIGNRVILLGTVPDQDQKQQAQQIARQASGARQIDNRLQVSRQARPIDDAQLEQSIQQQLPSDLAQDVQVQAQNGRVTLQGSVQSWQDVADAIEAVFASGAQQVTSRLVVGGQRQFDTQREFDEGQQYGQAYDEFGTGRTAQRPYGYGREDAELQRRYGRDYETRDRDWQTTGQYDRYGRGMARAGRSAQRWQQSARSRQLQQRLTSQLQNQIPGAEGITVLASDDAVFLFGRVPDDQAKEQATELVESMPGIERVENNLIVSEEGWEPQDDATIQNEVRDELWWSPYVDSDDIQIRVSNGVVTLMGSVEDFGEMTAAIENAYEGGARAVRNQLRIRDQMTAAERDFDYEPGYYPPYGYTPGQEDQMQQMDTGISGDERCIQMLKQGVANGNLQSLAQNVYVTCHEGMMALYGYVKSDEEKEQLENLTQEIPGVTEVDNNLIVRKEGAEQKSDAELKEDVESQLWWSPFVDSDKIEVTVQNGTVTLSGEADDWDAMRAAVKNAFDAGAQRVRSRIRYGADTDQESVTGQAGVQQPGMQGSTARQSGDRQSGNRWSGGAGTGSPRSGSQRPGSRGSGTY